MVEFKDIKITWTTEVDYDTKHKNKFYYFEYEIYNWRGLKMKNKLTYYDMHQMIVSMSEIKIKNYFNKNFDMFSQSSVRFNTEDSAKEAYEWLKQKCMETTLIGVDTLRQNNYDRIVENRKKREEKEAKKANEEAKINLEKFKKHIGKTTTLPISWGEGELKVPVTICDLSFDSKDLYYCLKTSIGDIKIYYKFIEINEDGISTTYEQRSDLTIIGNMTLDLK